MVLSSQSYCAKALFIISLFLVSINNKVAAQGTWSTLNHLAPDYNGGVMLLLTDGTVIVKSYYGGMGASLGTTWDRLTPDANGSYKNGTWSTIAPMTNDRLYFSSWILNDGRVYVGGGEYGAGTLAEIYNPFTNTWSAAATTGVNVSDGGSENLPDGKLLLASNTGTSKKNYLYDPATNTATVGPDNFFSHDEASWLKLPDNSILQVDFNATTTERYIPATNTWVADATCPVILYDSHDFEVGPSFLLPDGRGFFIGATGHTAFYTPSGNTSPGTWSAGPDLPAGKGIPDGSGAMLNNGKILLTTSAIPAFFGDFPSPTTLYEFDYLTNTFTLAPTPWGGSHL